MAITWEETLAEHEARGKAQGQLKEARRAVVLLIDHRFGSTPPAVDEKLEAIEELSRLHEILEQALEVQSIDELNLDP